MQFIKLDMGCRGYSDYISLGSYFENSSKKKFTIDNDFQNLPNISDIKTWKPIPKTFGDNYNFSIPKHLKNVNQLHMDRLIQQLKNLREVNIPDETPFFPFWVYIIIALAALSILLIFICYCWHTNSCKSNTTVKTRSKTYNEQPLVYTALAAKEQLLHKESNQPSVNDNSIASGQQTKTFLSRLYPQIDD